MRYFTKTALISPKKLAVFYILFLSKNKVFIFDIFLKLTIDLTEKSIYNFIVIILFVQ